MFSKWCFKFHIVTIMTLRSLTHMSLTFGLIYAYGEVDILNDLKKYPIKPSFGRRICKPEEVVSFISIVEDFFPSKYKDADKIKAA